MKRPCSRCGQTTTTFPRSVPADRVLCYPCFERGVVARTGARVEVRDGQRVLVGIALRKDWKP